MTQFFEHYQGEGITLFAKKRQSLHQRIAQITTHLIKTVEPFDETHSITFSEKKLLKNNYSAPCVNVLTDRWELSVGNHPKPPANLFQSLAGPYLRNDD